MTLSDRWVQEIFNQTAFTFKHPVLGFGIAATLNSTAADVSDVFYSVFAQNYFIN